MSEVTVLTEIARDTLEGLNANPKFLLPKYFYNDEGSLIFQQIMQMPEYYLTDCEYEIFTKQKNDIVDAFCKNNSGFNLIELGSGDGLKTMILLKHLVSQHVSFNYIPIDISEKAHEELIKNIKSEIPNLNFTPKTGDFFNLLDTIKRDNRKNVIMFLGANIGNFSSTELKLFLKQIQDFTKTGDRVLIGFDLKKSPEIIMKAYNDAHGHTRNFNLNHLTRLNEELGANFNIDHFEQHTEYNPITGAVKSYLVSTKNQTVEIEDLEQEFSFEKWEAIYMEMSRKFDLQTIEEIAAMSNFKIVKHFMDSKSYFVDSLWEKV